MSNITNTTSPAPTEFSNPENESWYIWIECVPRTLLMPLFIVLIGIICQAIIAFFITFPLKSPQQAAHDLEMQHKGNNHVPTDSAAANTIVQSELNNNCGCCFSFKKSSCGRGTSYCLMVWQILTMVIILILDMVGFFNWKESHIIDEIYDSTTWNNYQCFSARIIISSNYSLVCLNFVAMVINPDWKDGFRIAWNIATGALFFCYIIWLIMYGLVGALTYFWITAVIVGITAILYFTCKCSKLGKQCFYQIFGPIILFFFVGILGLTMINLFEGYNYWTAFENVLLERRWIDYYENVTAESVFRWFTNFLG